MYHFGEDDVFSIKRVMSTDNYILKKYKGGVKLLTINDFEQNKFTLQHMLDVQDNQYGWLTGCIQVHITPSQIVIAAAQNEAVGYKNKVSTKLMKIPIT